MNYKNISILSYINKNIKNGNFVLFKAIKVSNVIAVKNINNKIITMSVDEFGNPIQEKVFDPNNEFNKNKVFWIITKADESGSPIIDEHGNLNQSTIDDKIFSNKYALLDEKNNIYKPIESAQFFVELFESIVFLQGGTEMKISNGGYLNVTDLNDIYGISKRDFLDTYKIITHE
ncbi:MAG: hypothetical protein R3Y21_00855 [Mycoplasmatota bacterium]